MPRAPLLVASDLSVPVTLPQSQSNVTVTIGGQKVNVTLYWEPNSITLEGQILVLPPQTSGSVTIQYQPQQYFPIPFGKSTTAVPGTTITQTVAAGITATNQNAARAEIPPFNPSNGQKVAPATTMVAANGLGRESLLLVGGVIAIMVALVALTLIVVTVRGRTKPSLVSAF
jgi:hypothetical protein